MDDFFFMFFKRVYEEKIEVIGIMDYFFIDRYLDVINYVKEIYNKVDEDFGDRIFFEDEINFIWNIFIFLNVELRIFLMIKKGKFINLYFIFDFKIVESLSNEFFNKILNVENYLMNY